jgi:cytochrome c oxidase subunit 1
MLFVLGFIVTFVLGGLTGVQIASIPLDLQLHDTFFIVAHFHYVLIGGAVFPVLGGIYHWFPKMAGRIMSERLGKLNFALVFAGFHLTFFPMHLLGLHGMPRRVYTYRAETGWEGLNLLASAGALVIALGGLVFLANVVWSLRRGACASADPWGADSLEWAVPSPPPNYNFANIPVVRGRYANWAAGPEDPVITGLYRGRREVLITDLMDAHPDHRHTLPASTIWPFLTAVAVTVAFVGSLFNPWWLVPGIALTIVGLTGWFWPREHVVLLEQEEG